MVSKRKITGKRFRKLIYFSNHIRKKPIKTFQQALTHEIQGFPLYKTTRLRYLWLFHCPDLGHS
jgi:hypothetical protein